MRLEFQLQCCCVREFSFDLWSQEDVAEGILLVDFGVFVGRRVCRGIVVFVINYYGKAASNQNA